MLFSSILLLTLGAAAVQADILERAPAQQENCASVSVSIKTVTKTLTVTAGASSETKGSNNIANNGSKSSSSAAVKTTAKSSATTTKASSGSAKTTEKSSVSTSNAAQGTSKSMNHHKHKHHHKHHSSSAGSKAVSTKAGSNSQSTSTKAGSKSGTTTTKAGSKSESTSTKLSSTTTKAGSKSDTTSTKLSVSTSQAGSKSESTSTKLSTTTSKAGSKTDTTSTKGSTKTTASSAAASTSSSIGGGKNTTTTVATGGSKNNTDPQTSFNLDPSLVQSNLAQDGQAVPVAGQVKSLTSLNNFINFCLTQKTVITNGLQTKTGSCNPIPMGRIIATDKMPSSKFVNPKNTDVIPANKLFTIKMAIKNINTGSFVNPQTNYYAAPAQVDATGTVIGHSHVVIESIPAIGSTDITDPTKFAFFKGLNGVAQGGILSTDVTGGLPAGSYRMASINAAANHQPVLGAVAQHGTFDDWVYFTTK